MLKLKKTDFTPEVQVKFLQFLQDYTFRRVGGNVTIRPNIRVIAATNIPLVELVRKGLFREDLYYRLFVAVLELPSLSERREDIPELSAHFMHEANETFNRAIVRFTPNAFKKLMEHSYPGNIRELRNTILRAALLCKDAEITEDMIQFPEDVANKETNPAKISHENSRDQFFRLNDLTNEELINAIIKRGGNLARTAKALNLSRRALYYQISKRKIDPDQYRV